MTLGSCSAISALPTWSISTGPRVAYSSNSCSCAAARLCARVLPSLTSSTSLVSDRKGASWRLAVRAAGGSSCPVSMDAVPLSSLSQLLWLLLCEIDMSVSVGGGGVGGGEGSLPFPSSRATPSSPCSFCSTTVGGGVLGMCGVPLVYFGMMITSPSSLSLSPSDSKSSGASGVVKVGNCRGVCGGNAAHATPRVSITSLPRVRTRTQSFG